MKLTKYEHACIVLENVGKTLVIDPGVFTQSMPLDVSYDYVVITHEHSDHIDPEKIRQIFQRNPSVHFFTNQKIYEELVKKYGAKHTVITSGAKAQVDGFSLQFFGQDHAIIYQTSPCANNGVLVNEAFYYAGDSFVPPDAPVMALAVPASAPWMKIAEAMEYVSAVKPKTAFPTHNALLSEFGELITYNWLRPACEQVGVVWQVLAPGQSVEV